MIDSESICTAQPRKLTDFRPHDLLWVTRADAFCDAAPLPDWAGPDWRLTAPVVVRREKVDDPNLIPVGMRGTTRSQRFRTYLTRDAIARVMSPEELTSSLTWSRIQLWRRIQLGPSAALELLTAVAPTLDALGLNWGPTGGVGFALASGLPVLSEDSDLDLIVRAPVALTEVQRKVLSAIAIRQHPRMDIQVETARGSFALAEWLRGGRRIMMKTAQGPALTNDPWSGDLQIP